MTDVNGMIAPKYDSLKMVAAKLFALITKELGVKIVYITRRGKTDITVLRSYNEDELIIPEGYSVEYSETYCRLIIMNENEEMHTMNLTKNAITRELEVTNELNVKGFLGVTLKDMEGNVFGTLCVMDKDEKDFSDDDVSYLKKMANILSHIIELDETKYNLSFLGAPIIPLAKGVSVLSIQGLVDEKRYEQIMGDVLNEAASKEISFFIIDLSKLYVQNNEFSSLLFNMTNALQLMGVQTFITGMTPAFALGQGSTISNTAVNTKFVTDIKTALQYTGYTIEEKR